MGSRFPLRFLFVPIPEPLSPGPFAFTRGITLTEVLISMFVLMIGLLGVAAMIPAGRHEILEGSKIDNATAVGRAAFRDLKIRGYLNPANWRLADGTTPSYNPPDGGHSTYCSRLATIQPDEPAQRHARGRH